LHDLALRRGEAVALELADVAIMNEALAKILCYNLCCLIQSIYE